LLFDVVRHARGVEGVFLGHTCTFNVRNTLTLHPDLI